VERETRVMQIQTQKWCDPADVEEANAEADWLERSDGRD
jgi:hypothetical protein